MVSETAGRNTARGVEKDGSAAGQGRRRLRFGRSSRCAAGLAPVVRRDRRNQRRRCGSAMARLGLWRNPHPRHRLITQRFLFHRSLAMPRVLIADALSAQAVAVFKNRGIETLVKTGLSPQELKALIVDFDGLAVRSATKVTKPVIDAAARLKVIGRAGIGVDTIDVPAATARGIVVMNTPFGNSITTAEHAIAMMFALARELPAADRSTQA